MPVVEIHLIEGYGASEKARLGTALTDAVRSVVPAPADAVTVIMHDLPHSDYYRGGVTRMPAPARPGPTDIVRSFLTAMEARDLDTAQSYLAESFAMTFPGTAPMHSLQELIDWAAPRYRFVKKAYDGFDTSQGEDAAIVYCRGTLHGAWPDGTAFANIRFIDRFEITGGKITKQDVWNDIAEVKATS